MACSENCNESGCNHDCENCGKINDPKSFQEAPHEMSRIDSVIGVVSGKGGVGKSLVSALLACAARRKGYQTAVMDADITGPSIPKAFGVTDKLIGNDFGIVPAESKTGVKITSINLLMQDPTDPVIWRGPVIGNCVKQFWKDVIWSDVDYMFVDMPPGTGDVPLTVFQTIPVKGIVVVATPQDLVSLIVTKAIKMAEMMNIPVLAIVENMSYYQCPKCGEKHSIFGESKIEEIAKEHGVEKVVKLPIDPSIAQACDRGEIETVESAGIDEAFDYISSWLEAARKVGEEACGQSGSCPDCDSCKGDSCDGDACEGCDRRSDCERRK